MLLERYRSIFNRLYGEDRDLTLRRGCGLPAGLAEHCCYIAYAWIDETIAGRISLGT